MSDKTVETINHMPKKRNVPLEALKSVLTAVGISFGIDAIRGKLGETLKGENLKPRMVEAGVLATLIAAYNIHKTVKHNQEVDDLTKQQTNTPPNTIDDTIYKLHDKKAGNFTDRIEQETAAPVASPSAPSR